MGPPPGALNISAPFRSALRYSVPCFYIPFRSASRFSSRSASCVIPFCVPFCVPLMRLVSSVCPASRPACRSCVLLAVSFCVPFSLLICGARPDFRVGRRFVLLAACRLVLRLVLGVCVSALYAALAFRPCVSLLRFAMRSVLRSDMRAALYHAWLLARGRWFP